MDKRKLVHVQFKDCRSLTLAELMEDDDFSEGDEEDFQMGVNAIKSKRCKKSAVTVFLPETGNTFPVRTRKFNWPYLWLRAQVEVSQVGNSQDHVFKNRFKTVKYSLDEEAENAISPISLFLDSLGSHEQMKKDFLNYIETDCLPHDQSFVCLSNMNNLLSGYERKKETPGCDIRSSMNSTEPGGVLKFSSNAPKFFQVAPLLFPKKIASMICFGEEDNTEDKEDLQKKLEGIMNEDPWKFGFGPILFKETKARRSWSGLEANLNAMKSAPFYKDLSKLHRDALHVYDIMKDVCRQRGHTYLRMNDLEYWEREWNLDSKQRGNSKRPKKYYGYRVTDIYGALFFLEEKEVVKIDVGNNEERFHLMRYWRAEENIKTCLETLVEQHRPLVAIDMRDAQFDRIRDDTMQSIAAAKIVENPITMISGRGGTGKTEVVTTVLEAIDKKLIEEEEARTKNLKEEMEIQESEACFKGNESFRPNMSIQVSSNGKKDENNPKQKPNGNILYAAPTGKAASVIRKRAKKKAFTIHQVLGSYKSYVNSDHQNPWKFGETRILALDETSMVSLELFSSLISCLLEGSRLCKIVLLGDYLQLPSIDPGNLMTDLFKAFKVKEFVVELKKNHRSEGSLIFENASRISGHEMPLFNHRKGFSFIATDRFDEKDEPKFAFRCAKKHSDDNVLKQKLPAYLNLLRKRREEFHLLDPVTSQFISFKNNECEALNEACCWLYNRHLTHEVNENGRDVRSFQINDKIMATKNNDVPVFVSDEDLLDSTRGIKEESAEIASLPKGPLKQEIDRLMNGSVYMINSIQEGRSENCSNNDLTSGVEEAMEMTNKEKFIKSTKVNYYELDDLAGEIVRPAVEPFMMACRPSHAWALTIHKFQGSESDHIVYGVSDSGQENWQHVYTAVTRGKKSVLIVGRMNDLRAAVKRSPNKRQTTLSDKVKLMLSRAKARPAMACDEMFDDDDFELLASQLKDEDLNNGILTDVPSSTPEKRAKKEEPMSVGKIIDQLKL